MHKISINILWVLVCVYAVLNDFSIIYKFILFIKCLLSTEWVLLTVVGAVVIAVNKTKFLINRCYILVWENSFELGTTTSSFYAGEAEMPSC